mgnify:FL=1
MAGRSNNRYFQPRLEELIPLPEGSELFTLPDRLPIGTDPHTGEPLLLESDPYDTDRPINAVAAFMSPAHTMIYNAAFERIDQAVTLPLFAYCAVGWHDGQFWVSGFRSDQDQRQDASHFNQTNITKKTRKKTLKYKNNRLIQHLGKCCLTYHCPAARNFFLGRWEAPLPTSPACNARCVGCISLQPSGCCSSTQERIKFVPSPQEIAEVALLHLAQPEGTVVSFGQGCEGEPLLQTPVIEKAISLIRKRTDRGTINMNTNSSLPENISRLAHSGLDSIRVSLNSAQPDKYHHYYRPVDYDITDVFESITVMKSAGKFVSLNYFVQPGFTDSHEETEALTELLEKTQPDFIQLRNLNMDPDWYLSSIEMQPDLACYGILQWLDIIKSRFSSLQFGYFNPALNENFI